MVSVLLSNGVIKIIPLEEYVHVIGRDRLYFEAYVEAYGSDEGHLLRSKESELGGIIPD